MMVKSKVVRRFTEFAFHHHCTFKERETKHWLYYYRTTAVITACNLHCHDMSRTLLIFHGILFWQKKICMKVLSH